MKFIHRPARRKMASAKVVVRRIRFTETHAINLIISISVDPNDLGVFLKNFHLLLKKTGEPKVISIQ